jgi:hypothetical protein
MGGGKTGECLVIGGNKIGKKFGWTRRVYVIEFDSLRSPPGVNKPPFLMGGAHVALGPEAERKGRNDPDGR